MSTCIRAGVRYNKHIYTKGGTKCLKCGRVKEIFSATPEDTGTSERPQAEPQTTEPQSVTAKLTTRDDLRNQWEPGDVPEDLTPAYNKDTIKE